MISAQKNETNKNKKNISIILFPLYKLKKKYSKLSIIGD